MNTKHGIVIGLAIVAFGAASGCAASKSVQRGDGAAVCTIEDARFPSATRDFDRSTTLRVLASLTEAAANDREQLKTGVRSAVGGKLDTLASQKPGNAFIANDVAELATRLHQLDCSVRAGMAMDTADQRFAQILVELKVEKNILDPSAGSEITPTRAVQ